MTGLEVLLVLIVLGSFALIVLMMIRSQKSSQRNKKDQAEGLGMQPLDQVPSSVQQRIEWLHKHRSSQEIEIQNLATLQHRQYTLFLCDLIDIGGDSVSNLQDDTILLISPQLSLPRFTLISKIDQDHFLANLVNKIVAGLVDRQGNEFVKLSSPELDDKFLLFGNDAERINSFFDRISLGGLHPSGHIMIEAGGDAFTYGQLPYPSGELSRPAKLQRSISEAGRWLRAFQHKTA